MEGGVFDRRRNAEAADVRGVGRKDLNLGQGDNFVVVCLRTREVCAAFVELVISVALPMLHTWV